MKPSILFVDSTYPSEYDFTSLSTQGLGGTESSLLHTAKILQNNGLSVSILQHCRQRETVQQGVRLLTLETVFENQFEHVVILRKFPRLQEYQKHFPKAKFYLWLHTYKAREYALKRCLPTRPFTVICNSKTHAKQLQKMLNQGLLGRFISLFRKPTPVTYCYNPVPDYGKTINKPKKKINQLIFISAPNKGLNQVLTQFQKLSQNQPDLTLLIANPEYRKTDQTAQHNVHYIGSLPKPELLQKIAESLCIFYPQDSFAETFGFVYAEANAVGTPVLAHDIGAAKEILHPQNPLINVQNFQQIQQTINHWQQSPPHITHRQQFDESNVFKQWQKTLKLKQPESKT